MRLAISFMVFVLCVSACLPAYGILYGITMENALYAVNSTTGQLQSLGTLNLPGEAVGLSYNYSNNKFYALSYESNCSRDLENMYKCVYSKIHLSSISIDTSSFPYRASVSNVQTLVDIQSPPLPVDEEPEQWQYSAWAYPGSFAISRHENVPVMAYQFGCQSRTNFWGWNSIFASWWPGHPFNPSVPSGYHCLAHVSSLTAIATQPRYEGADFHGASTFLPNGKYAFVDSLPSGGCGIMTGDPADPSLGRQVVLSTGSIVPRVLAASTSNRGSFVGNDGALYKYDCVSSDPSQQMKKVAECASDPPFTGMTYVGPSLYGLLVTSHEANAPSDVLAGRDAPACRGDLDVDIMQRKMESFFECEQVLTRKIDFHSPGNSQQSVFMDLAEIEKNIQPGDDFVFYYVGHGFGNKVLDPKTEAMVLNSSNSGASEDQRKITDDEIRDWFLDESVTPLGDNRTRKEIWADVNKVFILDTCHADGFREDWDDFSGAEQDLSKLDNCGVMAAAENDENACYADNLEYLGHDILVGRGQGYYSALVFDGLTCVNGIRKADLNRDGLLEWDSELAVYVEQLKKELDDEGVKMTGWSLQDPGSDGPSAGEWTSEVVSWFSDDFDMTLGVPIIVVPEPGILTLLASVFGMLILRQQRSR